MNVEECVRQIKEAIKVQEFIEGIADDPLEVEKAKGAIEAYKYTLLLLKSMKRGY